MPSCEGTRQVTILQGQDSYKEQDPRRLGGVDAVCQGLSDLLCALHTAHMRHLTHLTHLRLLWAPPAADRIPTRSRPSTPTFSICLCVDSGIWHTIAWGCMTEHDYIRKVLPKSYPPTRHRWHAHVTPPTPCANLSPRNGRAVGAPPSRNMDFRLDGNRTASTIRAPCQAVIEEEAPFRTPSHLTQPNGALFRGKGSGLCCVSAKLIESCSGITFCSGVASDRDATPATWQVPPCTARSQRVRLRRRGGAQ